MITAPRRDGRGPPLREDRDVHVEPRHLPTLTAWGQTAVGNSLGPGMRCRGGQSFSDGITGSTFLELQLRWQGMKHTQLLLYVPEPSVGQQASGLLLAEPELRQAVETVAFCCTGSVFSLAAHRIDTDG